MGTDSRHGNGDGSEQVSAAHGVPATAKKMVQSVMEIVKNCTEQEIYTVLEECDMDPNLAVERLLSQDMFREVRSKRERKKEMKEAVDSRTRVYNAGLSRGGKSGSDRSVGQSGFSHVTYNVSEHCKAIDKGEGGSVCPSVASSTTHVVEKSTKCDYFTDNGRQSLATGESMSASSQSSVGPQPLMIGVSKGRLSMADVVRMGRTSQDAVSHKAYNTSGVSASVNSESRSGLDCQNHKKHVFHDEWPVIEQPVARNSEAPHVFSSSNDNGHFDHRPSLDVTALCIHRNSELDAAHDSEVGVVTDNVDSENAKSASPSPSSKHTILSSNTGLESPSNSNLRNSLSSDFHNTYEHHEDVSSAASIFQRLSIGEPKWKVPTFKDDPTVVIPNHLQALAADCSYLSFGTYNGGSSSASSAIVASNNYSKSGLEMSAAVDDSLAPFLDASSVYNGDKQLGFDVLRGTSGDKSPDFLSYSQQEFVKHIVPEEAPEHEYHITAPLSDGPDPSFLKSTWMNPSLPPKQPGLQGGNHSSFTQKQYANPKISIPGDMAYLISQSQPARHNNAVSSMRNPANSMSEYADPKISLPDDTLAFLISQSQPVRHNNAVSSMWNPASSMSEVMESGAFALPKRSAVPQDLTVQSSIDFQQLPDSKGYLSLPQNQSYITNINSRQTFSGNAAYNQYPHDLKYNLPLDRNEFHTSRLPSATIRDALGYGNHGSSFHSPGSFLSNSSLGHMRPLSNFNEILPSQYNGGRNFNSVQPHDSFSRWDSNSRSSLFPERTQYNFPGHPDQPSQSQYVGPGYSELNHSQERILEELRQRGGSKNLSSKQLHPFWQHRH